MKKNILIVDDSALVRRAICDIINASDEFEATDTCRDGLEAYEKIKTNSYDAVLLDINMPRMNGLELLQKLQKENIRATVVVVSSLAKEDAKITIQAMEYGAIDFITKPQNIIETKGVQFRNALTALLNSVLPQSKLSRPSAPAAPAKSTSAPAGKTPAATGRTSSAAAASARTSATAARTAVSAAAARAANAAALVGGTAAGSTASAAKTASVTGSVVSAAKTASVTGSAATAAKTASVTGSAATAAKTASVTGSAATAAKTASVTGSGASAAKAVDSTTGGTPALSAGSISALSAGSTSASAGGAAALSAGSTAAPAAGSTARAVPRTRQNGGGKKLVALACSTGGPKSLQSVIPYLDKNMDAPMVLVQHMPTGFTKSLAERLNELSKVQVKEAEENDVLQKGWVYVAPGGYHLEVVAAKDGTHRIHLSDAPAIGGLRPCANVMYRSLKKAAYDEIVCVVLTGMGADGTDGIRELNQAKPIYVIAQDEPTCVVYGMPKAVAEAGLTDEVVPLTNIPKRIINQVGVK